MILDDLFAVN